jgi:hypothetical protein
MAGLLFRHPLVRALAWLIGSPSLLRGTSVVNDAWCQDALARSQSWLRKLDVEPAALEAYIAERRIARIGRLAEALMGYWLRYDGRFELLAENLAVRDGGRTLGDFDFIAREAQSGQVFHWELTVKFYLHRPEIGGFSGYVGPRAKDILAAKAGHITDRQLKLADTPAGQAALALLGVTKIEAKAFCKGWLFYPGPALVPEMPDLNPGHARGTWWRHAAGAQVPAGHHVVLDRLQWLTFPACVEAERTLDSEQLSSLLDARVAGAGESLLVARVEPENGIKPAVFRETSRAFVVPLRWGEATSETSP